MIEVNVYHACHHRVRYRVDRRHARTVLERFACRIRCEACTKAERATLRKRRAAKRALGTVSVRAVRQLYLYIWREPLPANVHVVWKRATDMWNRGCVGEYVAQGKGATIVLNRSYYHDARDHVLETLVHEFIHHRHRELKHGAEFYRLEEAALRKLGLRATQPHRTAEQGDTIGDDNEAA